MVGWSHAPRLPLIVLNDRFLATQCTAQESIALSAYAADAAPTARHRRRFENSTLLSVVQ